MPQIEKDFNLPKGTKSTRNSKLRSFGNAEIIELPTVLDGLAQPYLRLIQYDSELTVEFRLKVTLENGPCKSHDLILKTRSY
jgi:hypothetical protein